MKNVIVALFLAISSFNLSAQEASPSFILKDIDGNSIEVIDIKEGLIFKGHQHAVLLLMFGHNCPPCKAEIPTLKELYKKHKDKLSIIALEVQGYDSDKIKEFKSEYGINYTLISGKENTEFVRHIVYRSGWKGAIPFLIAIDKKGEVQLLHAGPIKASDLEKLVSKLNS